MDKEAVGEHIILEGEDSISIPVLKVEDFELEEENVGVDPYNTSKKG